MIVMALKEKVKMVKVADSMSVINEIEVQLST